ncbi:hypothetical protein F5887DRAFT_1082515 [Amanita rubescens]|nr:hypothetical protein F5887DRAFT_1082515 [Amanita rubescens]
MGRQVTRFSRFSCRFSVRHLSSIPKTFEDTSLADAIRTPLTRNIGTKFPEIYDEITAAFIHVPAGADEWIKIRAYPIMMDIACRASNRMLVWLPLCRNPDYIELNKQFTVDIVKMGNLINIFPSFLKRIVVRFTDVASGIERGMRHLGPLINERLEQEARYGKDWLDKPSDIITWLFEVFNISRCITSLTARRNERTSSEAWRMSSILSGPETTIIHCAIIGTLKTDPRCCIIA